jgi:hypothetical protein
MADIVIIRKPGRPYASFKVLRVCQTTEEGERQIGRRESDNLVLCAGQRPDQEGSSPSGARMRGAISEGGGNSSLAGEPR